MENDTKSNILETPKTADGIYVGQDSADKVGFYGTTPVAQPSSASQASVAALGTTTISAANTSAVFGFSSSTAAAALVTKIESLRVLVNQLRSELVTLGVIKGSA